MDEASLKKLQNWSTMLLEYHIPRWEELPDFAIYMDQVITLIERYLHILNDDKETIITSAMVNNYVKLKLIPKPEKKRYSKEHIAYLIAITLLKQILSISEVRDGIAYQAKISGTHVAYNIFCEEQEKAFRQCALQILKTEGLAKPEDIPYEDMVVKMAVRALAEKLVAQKIVYLQRNQGKEEKENEERKNCNFN